MSVSHPVRAAPFTIKYQLLPLDVHTPEAASGETWDALASSAGTVVGSGTGVSVGSTSGGCVTSGVSPETVS